MTQGERDRLVALKKAKKKLITQREAAAELGITERQVRRLLHALKRRGDKAVVHALRGLPSNRKVDVQTQQKAVEILSRPVYQGFGPTLASEYLAKKHKIQVSRETTRQWMMEAKLWRARKQRLEKVHGWRDRKDRCGEMVEWDTSKHDWLEGRGEEMLLIAMIDDATSRWFGRFVPSDSTVENMNVLEQYVKKYGRPWAYYTDKAALFQTAEKSQRGESAAGKDRKEMPPTQIGRALQELGIQSILAHSPQAKGRVERGFATAQDRLVKGMRAAGSAHPVREVADLEPRIGFFLLLLTSLVLLVACMNVANIMLVRATVRQREMAIRAALGSGRGRLIRQMLTESVLLALLGGAAGLVLGVSAADGFAGSMDLATDLPIHLDFSFDWRVFAYALTAAVVAGILVGILPALRASKAEAGAALHDGGRSNSGGPKRQHMRSLLVVGQVAGSLVLLISAGLFVRSLRNAQRLDLGFVHDHVFNVRLNPQWAGYDVEHIKAFYRELERRVKAWPEVRSASFAFSSPLGYFNNGDAVYIEGRDVVPGKQPPLVMYNSVNSAYFETMQIPILRGRASRESDSETAPLAAVINQTMAGTYWPNQDPIGKRFRTHSPESPLREVVGIARDGKYLLVFEKQQPYFYLPLAQDYRPARILQIRSSVPPELLSNRLEREVEALDPNVPMSDLQTMTRSLGGSGGFLMFRIGAIQASALGLVGLVLALVGVYGVVSYGAAQRTREIGIRIALGATPRVVRSLIMRQGAGLVLSGILVGWVGASALMRVLLRFLLLPSPNDPAAFFGVPGGLALVALWACYIPARRAMRVDPTEALRHE